MESRPSPFEDPFRKQEISFDGTRKKSIQAKPQKGKAINYRRPVRNSPKLKKFTKGEIKSCIHNKGKTGVQVGSG
jgi:hypothetical protein